MAITGTIKVGSRLVIDVLGASNVDYSITVSGYDVSIQKNQIKNAQAFGPYKNSATYSITVNSGSPAIYTENPDGVKEYTAATLPDPATLGAGVPVVIGEMPLQIKGGKWHGEYTVGSGIPFIVPSSGNITSTTGGVTVTTAFAYIIGPSFTFFPQSALYPLSPSGWYYVEWTTTSAGKVYADVYYNDVPQIPVTPTPLTTVVGAYTQVVNLPAIGPSYIIPAGFLGKNGAIVWNRQMACNATAGQKSFTCYFGLDVFQATNVTTNIAAGAAGSLLNRGVETRQIGCNANFGDSGLASGNNKLIVDTGVNQIFSLQAKLAVATDFAIIEAHTITIKRGE